VQSWEDAFRYVFIIVKFPDPVHPGVNPVKVHVPVMVLLFTVP
jgi:hypothetical protein